MIESQNYEKIYHLMFIDTPISVLLEKNKRRRKYAGVMNGTLHVCSKLCKHMDLTESVDCMKKCERQQSTNCVMNGIEL